jgi:hypothetical protein
MEWPGSAQLRLGQRLHGQRNFFRMIMCGLRLCFLENEDAAATRL